MSPRPGQRRDSKVAVTALLRSLREEEGLTRQAMGKRLGISGHTVGAVEAGRSASMATLCRYLEAFPRLTPAMLLGLPDRWAPAACDAAWLHQRDVAGFVVGSVRLAVSEGAATIDILDVAPCTADLADPIVRTALMRAIAITAAPDLLRRLDARAADLKGWRLVEQDDANVHEWRLSPPPRRALSYSRRPREDHEPGLAGGRVADATLAINWPVEQLELVAARPPGDEDAEPRLLVWPDAVPLDDATEIAREVHPSGTEVSSGSRHGAAVVVVTRPPMALRYALTWRPSLRGGIAPGVRTPATALLRARGAVGWSMRALAEEAGITAVSVMRAEHGREAHADTVRALVSALPGLSPQEMMPANPTTPKAFSREHALEHQARLVGSQAAEVRKTVTIGPDGQSTCRIETRGLRSLRGSLGDVRVRMSLQRAVVQASPSVIRSIEAEAAEDIHTRTIRIAHGPSLHEIRFPRRLAQAGITYTRTYAGQRYYLRHSLAPVDPEEDFMEGVSLPIWHPVGRAEIVVQLPPGCVPTRIITRTWPLAVTPDPDLPSLSDSVPVLKPSVTGTDDGTTLRVAIEKPDVGTWLTVAWTPPE